MSEFEKVIARIRKAVQLIRPLLEAGTLPRLSNLVLEGRFECQDGKAYTLFHTLGQRSLHESQDKGVWALIIRVKEQFVIVGVNVAGEFCRVTVKAVPEENACCRGAYHGMIWAGSFCDCEVRYHLVLSDFNYERADLSDMLWKYRVNPETLLEAIRASADAWNARRQELATQSANIVAALHEL